MKIPVQEYSNMDNKLKISDRLKALLKTEARQDIDPYIFSEPEPFSAASKHLESSKSSLMSGKTSGSKARCSKKRIKAENSHIKCPDNISVLDSRRIDGDMGNMKNLELRVPNNSGIRSKEKSNNNQELVRRASRDHTLLYYPRAGDEISDSDSSSDELGVYQRHWFTGDTSNVPRAVKLSIQRSQLRRRLIQLHRSGKEAEELLYKRTRRLLQAAYRSQRLINGRLNNSNTNGKSSNGHLLVGGRCLAEGCGHTSLPCTRHCSRHIMMNTDQLLFEHCTAKFSDNTQCCVPVFDVAHELPLCPEHARKRDNYHRKAQESKPKKTRKKPASPTIPRPKSNSSSSKSRPKKRKRPPSVKPVEIKNKIIQEDNHYSSPIMGLNDNSDTKTLNNLNVVPQSTSNPNNLSLGLGLGSLGLGSSLKVELGDHEVFAALDPNEHDFGNVLNTLPADAFNDLFIESRNGEYEPSREEEEELERALEAVDKDVRNLERMGQTHGLLEPALLAQLMSDIAS
ncbi:INO80 complex subunit D [Chelonus insularis]|uniref:INO80 complex subunit D n=1 Tax=Chelonus insularis TaxID=460826 RepID=UPI00158F5E1F|nr:INO80 complex subunit D [Chelonus insularis]XP_034938437.1 INO80 complex subunit D [Chelonus insularis]XP_034938438.1 INO80 complex subunit D [Chelonus insularis]